MARLNILGLAGLSAKDREKWEQDNLKLIKGHENDFTWKDRLYRNQLFNDAFNPKINKNSRPKDPTSAKIWDQLNAKKLEEWNKLINMNNQQRDRYYADKMFDIAFSGDSRFAELSTLTQTQKDKLYLDKNFQTDDGNQINTDERPWWEKGYDWTMNKVAGAFKHGEFESTHGAGNPIESLIKGGSTGSILGSMIGFTVGKGLVSSWIGSLIGGYGIGNATKTYDNHKRDAAIESYTAASDTEMKSGTSETTLQYISNSDALKEKDYNVWKQNIDGAWKDMTKGNKQWEAFSGRSFTNLTEDLKATLLAQSMAISEKYGQDKAQKVFADSLTNIIAEGQAQEDGFWGTHVVHGAAPKFCASMMEKVTQGFKLTADVMDSDFMGNFLSDEQKDLWHRRVINYNKGLDENGNQLPSWMSNKYWDNVDKMGVWDAQEQENIVYGTNTQEYQDFINSNHTEEEWEYTKSQLGPELANNPNVKRAFLNSKHTKDEWIKMQEDFGDYKGTGISPYKAVSRVGEGQALGTKIGEGFEMSGYIADQMITNKLLLGNGKGTGWKGGAFGVTNKVVGKVMGGFTGELLDAAGATAETRLAFMKGLNTVVNKVEGTSSLAITSVPISVGYGMQTYDNIKTKGIESINNQIEKELANDTEYQTQLQNIGIKYNQLAESGQMSEEDAHNASMQEAQALRDAAIRKARYSKKEDYDALEKQARDGYNTDFTIELFRNMSIDLSYRAWMFKDANRMIKGTRPNIHTQGTEWGYGKAFLKSASSTTNKAVEKANRVITPVLNFFHKFDKYAEDEQGLVTLNESKLAKSWDYGKAVGKNLWGGFWSNYMDDVTVGFSEGWNISDFNDYMGKKYNAQSYDASNRNVLSGFLAGINSGADSMLDHQSFEDGYIGALGSVVSFNPFGLLGGIRLRDKYESGEARGKSKYAFDESGLAYSTSQKLRNVFGAFFENTNGIIGTIGMTTDARRGKAARLRGINKIISENEDKLHDVSSLLSWMQKRVQNKDWGDYLDMKDGNEGLGFALLSMLDKLNQESEGHSKLYSRYMQDIQRLADGQITKEDIQAFLYSPENSYLLDETRSVGMGGQQVQMNSDGRNLYAQYRIQENAQKLLKLNENYQKNRSLIEGAFGNYDLTDAATTQLAYSMTMQKVWEDRISELNSEITGSSNYNTNINDNVVYRSHEHAVKTIGQIDTAIKNTEKKIALIKDNINKITGLSRSKSLKRAVSNFFSEKGTYASAKQEYKASRFGTLKDTEELNQSGIETIQLDLQASRDALKSQEKLLDRLKRSKSIYQQLIKNNTETTNRFSETRGAEVYDQKVLSKQDILNLNPIQRTVMILHKDTFSKEQQKVINELINEELAKDPEFVQKVRDAGILYQRIQDNRTTINSIIEDREAFNRYTKNIQKTEAMNALLRYLNSDEFKQETEYSTARAEIMEPTSFTDENMEGLINATLSYIQKNGKDVDISNTASVLLYFDEHQAEIMNSLKDSEHFTLSTPEGEISSKQIRDQLESVTSNYTRHKAEIESRNSEVEVPNTEDNSSHPLNEEEHKEEETPVEKSNPETEAPENPETPEPEPEMEGEGEGNSEEKPLNKKSIGKYYSVEESKVAGVKAMLNCTALDGNEDIEYEVVYREAENGTKCPTIRIYIKGNKALGWFEVVKEPEKNTYTVYFNTEEVPSKDNSNIVKLSNALIDSIPAGCIVSTKGIPSENMKFAEEIFKDFKNVGTKETPQYYKSALKGLTPSEQLDTLQNIFEESINGRSSSMEFHNPLTWTNDSKTVRDIKERWRNLFGEESVYRMDELLAKYKDVPVNERPKVFYVALDSWHQDMVNQDADYNIANSLPIIAIIEDPEKGNIYVDGQGNVSVGPFGDVSKLVTTVEETATPETIDHEYQGMTETVTIKVEKDKVSLADLKPGDKFFGYNNLLCTFTKALGNNEYAIVNQNGTSAIIGTKPGVNWSDWVSTNPKVYRVAKNITENALPEDAKATNIAKAIHALVRNVATLRIDKGNILIKRLYSIDAQSMSLKELDDAITKVFDDLGLGKYWNNLDAYREKGVDKSTLRLAILTKVTSEKNKTLATEAHTNVKRYTAIGLAPVVSFENEWLNEHYTMSGQFRTEPIRRAAMDTDETVKTNKILTYPDGNPITSSLLKVKKHSPTSMKRGEFTSLADIAVNKLAFPQEEDPENIFSGIEVAKESSMYVALRDTILSRLEVRTLENSKGKTRKALVFLTVQEDGKTKPRYQEIFIHTPQTTMVTLPGINMGQPTSILEAIRNGQIDATIDNILLSDNGSKILRSLLYQLLNAVKTIFSTENRVLVPTIDLTGLEETEKANSILTNAVNRVLNNSNAGNAWGLFVDTEFRTESFEGKEVPHIVIKFRDSSNTDTELFSVPISATLKDIEDYFEDAQNTMNIIRKIMFVDKEGSLGPFRGDKALAGTNFISGFTWNVNFDDLANYNEAKQDMSDSKNSAKVNKAQMLFDDGIIAFSQNGISEVSAVLEAPFGIDNEMPVVPEVTNSDNAGDTSGSLPSKPLIPETPSSATGEFIEATDEVIDNILAYSRLKRGELAKKGVDKHAVKGRISATLVGSMLFDQQYSDEETPLKTVATTIGNDIDALLRDFFATDDEGHFTFDPNNINYAEYPNISEELFEELIEGLEAVKLNILERGEDRIISEEVITEGIIKVKIGDQEIGIPNVGHLDMMTRDKWGHVHIYDFKTFADAIEFSQHAFSNYQVQLNIYKNLLEKQFHIKVDSVHLVPLQVDYPNPMDESNEYTKDEATRQLYLNGDKFHVTQASVGLGLNLLNIILSATSKIRDKASERDAQLLKAIGFTQAEIEKLGNKKLDPELQEKVNNMSKIVHTILDIPMTKEVVIDMNSLSEAQKQKLLTIINDKLGKEAAPVTSLKVDDAAAPSATGLTIKSELEASNNSNDAVPNTGSKAAGHKAPIDPNLPAEKVEEATDEIIKCGGIASTAADDLMLD